MRFRTDVSQDIGADVGEFTVATLAPSRSVIAFEPRKAQARDLASMFDAVVASVRVEAVALSDEPGMTVMGVPESAVAAITEFLTLGYTGGFTIDNDHQPIEEFDTAPTHSEHRWLERRLVHRRWLGQRLRLPPQRDLGAGGIEPARISGVVSQLTTAAQIVTRGRPAVSVGHTTREDEETPMTDQRTRVVVVGGGYAGTLAANHLRQRPDIAVTLVNPRPVFVERIRLHQLMADTGAATADYGTLLGEGIRLIVDTVANIEAGHRRVLLDSGAELHYDYLIYAVGSTGAAPLTVPGAAEFAYSVADLESAQRLRYALTDLPVGAPVTVVGGGLTGIETASELAERRRPVTLVCGGVLGRSLSSRGRRSVAKRLRKLGVNVLESVAADRVRWDAVVLTDGTVLRSAAMVWTAGFAVPDLAARSGLSTDGLGRLLTDETLTSVDDNRIVAAGDAAAPSGRPLRMSCQAAGPLGAQAADTVLSRIAGNAPAVLNQAFVGQCISLGRAHGVFQLVRTDDTPVNVAVGGRSAASIKEAICKGTLWAIRREAAEPGSYRWLKGGDRHAQRSADQRVLLR